jgi:hypothetical protein
MRRLCPNCKYSYDEHYIDSNNEPRCKTCNEVLVHDVELMVAIDRVTTTELERVKQ